MTGFPILELLFGHGKKRLTKDLPYIKEMIRSVLMQKIRDPWFSYRYRTNNGNNCHITVLHYSLVRRVIFVKAGSNFIFLEADNRSSMKNYAKIGIFTAISLALTI